MEINKSPTRTNIPQPNRTVIILGMHRSGTSCLTGSLQQAGLELGEHSTWNLHNKKGNRENQTVVEFHERILSDHDSTWHTPPKKVKWTEAHFDVAKQLLSQHAHNDRWGFKDPRTLLMLHEWKKLIEAPQFVGIFRHPSAVAASIHKRGSGVIPVKKALELWCHYNKLLLKAYKKAPFPVLCFDNNEQLFHSKLTTVIEQLDLNPRTQEQFYTQDLINNAKNNNITVPWHMNRLYKKLLEIAE